MAKRFVLLGPPASGKGTQGRRLADQLGLAYLSTGALLRSAVEEGSGLGMEAAPILERHEYLPDALMCSIMGEWLAGQTGGWVLDGFPRSLVQAEFLSEWLADRDQKLDAAILLEVPEEVLLQRIRLRVECPECRWSGRRPELNGAGRCPECGGVAGPRADDTVAGFQSRFKEYRAHTLPVVAHYEARDVLKRFDAAQDPDGAEERLLKLVRTSHGQAA
ncbi:adenylate kinase family protein [Luteolibacter marinus]|uniref:adenylate kinase family protein n=1 Tax=Luteolibacter marinus TaxID=2776705 RepID=UPI0018678204|nr:nucleoside monophosphate kinase [Luteolibacter marinus]